MYVVEELLIIKANKCWKSGENVDFWAPLQITFKNKLGISTWSRLYGRLFWK